MTKKIAIYCLVLIATIILFEVSHLDQISQNLFFNPTDKTWLLDRHNKVLKFLFYDGCKAFLILVYLITLIFFLFFRNHPLRKAYRSGLLLFLISGVIVPSTIGFLKSETNIPCPRNLTIYGGNLPYKTVANLFFDHVELGKKCRCYPAGHASGGFALFSLFFLFKSPKNRKRALAVAMAIGWGMGLYKMMIGDHFLSHTVITMIMSWAMVNVIACLIFKFKFADSPFGILSQEEESEVKSS